MKIRFAEFTLDAGTRQLYRGSEELHLSRKAFDLLAILLQHRPGVVKKEALRDQLWAGTSVVDANLNNLASEIRTVLGDDAQQPRFLRTVHGVGYAFSGVTSDHAVAAPAADAGRRFWLVAKDRTVVLGEGRTLIGRDPDCAIWIDAPELSRRHACIRLMTDGPATTAMIEDLGSTNGTLVEGRRVTEPMTLEDGDVIRIGDAKLTFRSSASVNAPTRRIGKR